MGQEESRAEEEGDGDLPEPGGDDLDPFRAYQGNGLINRTCLERLLEKTWELDKHEAEAWTLRELEAIEGLTKRGRPLPAAALVRLWRGAPDSYKGLLWAAASGAASSGQQELYRAALGEAFGDRAPEHFERCPLFAWEADDEGAVDGRSALERRVPFAELLAPAGAIAAHRLLWCCSQLWHTRVEVCPVLPTLVVLLLLFCESEAAAYAVLLAVLTRAQEGLEASGHHTAGSPGSAPPPFPYLPLVDAQWGGLARRAVAIAAAAMPEVVGHLVEVLGVDLEEAAVMALQDGLASQLPFRAACRVYGAFLALGSEAFARALVVLWRHQSLELLACESKEAAVQLLVPPRQDTIVVEVARVPLAGDRTPSPSGRSGVLLGVDDLVRLATRLPIPRSVLEQEPELAPSHHRKPCGCEDEDAHLFCRPRLRGEASRVLWDALWPYLWHWLPPLSRVRDPVRCFAAHTDGYNLSSLLARCERAPEDSPMILAVRARTGDGRLAALGVFLPAAIRHTGNRYLDLATYGRAGCFAADAYVFSVLGDESSHEPPRAWHWSGHNELLFHAPQGTDEALLVGGDGVALSLDHTLSRGRTAESASFGSPRLLPTPLEEDPQAESTEYTVLDVEVFELD